MGQNRARETIQTYLKIIFLKDYPLPIELLAALPDWRSEANRDFRSIWGVGNRPRRHLYLVASDGPSVVGDTDQAD